MERQQFSQVEGLLLRKEMRIIIYGTTPYLKQHKLLQIYMQEYIIVQLLILMAAL